MSERVPESEVFPRVYFDIDHKNYIDTIDVDLKAITKLLQDGGLSDQEIIDLEIHFKTYISPHGFVGNTIGCYHRPSGDEQEESHSGAGDGKEYIEIGNHSRLKELRRKSLKKHSVSLKRLRLEIFYRLIFGQSFTGSGVNLSLSAIASKEYSNTLAHELDHAIAFRDQEQMKEDKDYLERTNEEIAERLLDATDFAARSGLAFILAQREVWYQYLDRPIEIRARAAGSAAPQGLVTIQSKQE